jgi:hypothetical protein
MKILHYSLVVMGMLITSFVSQDMVFADSNNPLHGFTTQFQLKVAQSFLLESDGIKITLLNITSDSRCPSDVTCIWQGESISLVNIVKNNQNVGNFNLTSITGQKNTVVQFANGYFMHVVNVEPSPMSGKKISSSDYLVTFLITKSNILSPHEQFKSGVHSADVQCTSGFYLVIKAVDDSPACVTYPTAQKLVQRGWAKSTSGIIHDSSKMLTLEQNNQEITLQKGDRFLLNLGSNYNWSPIVENNTVISRVPNVMVMQGAQGLFEAHNEGKTMLEATGDPPCLKTIPRCGMPSILFKVIVIVS